MAVGCHSRPLRFARIAVGVRRARAQVRLAHRLEAARQAGQNYRIYVTDIANAGKVIDYYKTALTNNGWHTVIPPGSNSMYITNGVNTAGIQVTPDHTDTTRCFIEITITPAD